MFRIALSFLFALGLGLATVGCEREREVETPRGEVETETDRGLNNETTPRQRSLDEQTPRTPSNDAGTDANR